MQRRDLLKCGAAAATFAMAARGGFAREEHPIKIPAEEHPHELTFMQWPVSRRVYSSRVFLQEVQATIADIANTIVEFEPVVMLAERDSHPDARKSLSDKVELWDIQTEDLWCRDSGPTFAITDKGERILSQIQFNGWGQKQVHKKDGAIAVAVAKRLGSRIIFSGLVGEAGGVEHDGHGLLIAHESSWVNANRNPGLSRNDIERKLLRAYGANELIWSPGLKDADITDYHIDSLARFVGPGQVLMNLPGKPVPQDPFYRAALETQKRLTSAGLKVDVIPEPERVRVKSTDFVASYVNFYVCNGAVVISQFGDESTDAIAAASVRRHYPGREIIALDVDALGMIGGGIHCATQQLPAVGSSY